jgi:epoxyqueuosine reductase
VTLGDLVKARAAEIGFDLVGIAPATPGRDLEFLAAWLARGYAGEMAYLSNSKRLDPRRVLPSVQSVVCVGLVYDTPFPYSTEVGSRQDAGAPRGWISRYAWGRDYHEIMREKLERLRAAIERLAPGAETRVFVDTGPLAERAFARWSGLGWMGKNTLILNERRGSWFFLGVILTNLALEPGLPAPDRCGSCTACLAACPTGALVEPYVLDARRCISYLTIELKGSIPEDLRPQMENHVFGCDICQDVCPWNGRQPSAVRRQWKEFEPMMVSYQPLVARPSEPALDERKLSLADATTARSDALPPSIQNPESETPNPPDTRRLIPDTSSLFAPPLEALAAMSEADFRRVFRHSPIRRTKYRGWLRNLCVAMGNSGDTRFIPRLAELAAHPEPLVREHAQWALARLQGGCL